MRLRMTVLVPYQYLRVETHLHIGSATAAANQKQKALYRHRRYHHQTSHLSAIGAASTLLLR
jgi:hypothetical protein